MEQKFTKLLENNAIKWNEWRAQNSNQVPIMRNVNFVSEMMHGKTDVYDLPSLHDIDFSDVDFNMASLRNCSFTNCCFDGAKITFADLVDTYFINCSFKNANMRVTKIGSAIFRDCIFEKSDLSYCSAEETSFEGTKFIDTVLEHMSFVSNNFTNSEMIGCHVYGISAWDLDLENSSQKNLIITKEEQPVITVDDIELAQFMYLMINNVKLRNIIDTITSKVVLILGNFSPRRKQILDEIREELRHHNYIPLMFDFEKPSSRNFTETVYTMAHMSRFVIADLSDSRSVGHELASIVPKLPSVTFYPLIVDGDKEYGMFSDLQNNYSWVKPILIYEPRQITNTLACILNEQKSNKGLANLKR